MPEHSPRERKAPFPRLAGLTALLLFCLAGTARSATGPENLTPEELKRIDDNLKVLRSGDAEWREHREAVRDLASMTSPAAHEHLLDEARKAQKEAVLYRLCLALVETEPAGVASVLMKRIERSSESLSPRLVELLGKTGDRRAVGPLVKIFRSSAPLAPRAQALSALAHIDDPEAGKTIFVALDDGDYHVRKAAGEAAVRLASEAKGPGGRAGEVATLLAEKIEKSEGGRAAYFVGILAGVGGDTAIDAVGGCLTSDDDAVVKAAIRAAGRMKAKPLAYLLRSIALSDMRPVRIRVLAIEALADAHAEEDLSELVPLLESENGRLKRAAHKALQRLTRRRMPPSVAVWETAVTRFEDEREYESVDDPDYDELPRAAPKRSVAAAAPEASPTSRLYLIIALSGIALAVALVLSRPALVRRKARAIDKKRRRSRRL